MEGNFYSADLIGEGLSLVYQKFGSLFFCCIVDEFESKFAILDILQITVELFDTVFKNCRELDIKLNPEKVVI